MNFFLFSAFFGPFPPLASAARCGSHPRRYATAGVSTLLSGHTQVNPFPN